MRPKSLAEVADLTRAGGSFDLSLANFLDEFYLGPDFRALEETPILLEPTQGELGRVRDAYLAATAEELTRAHSLPLPAWAEAEVRKLKYPWFASQFGSLRAVLIVESPAGFRSRNLFVSENALSRV